MNPKDIFDMFDKLKEAKKEKTCLETFKELTKQLEAIKEKK